MDREIWKWVVGYRGYYQVSNCGCVRSVDRKVGSRKYKGQSMRLWAHSNLYPVCELQREGQRRLVCVHSLVLGAFIGPRPDGCEAHHKNGDRTDNRIENLEWMPSFQHKSTHKKNATTPEGMYQKGELNPRAKLTKCQVLEIYAAGRTDTHASIAQRYGVDRSTISRILGGKDWTHLKEVAP